MHIPPARWLSDFPKQEVAEPTFHIARAVERMTWLDGWDGDGVAPPAAVASMIQRASELGS